MITIDDRSVELLDFTSQCTRCKHQNVLEPWTCKAFPKGVPFKISKNKFIHIEPYPGDHGIQFELIE